MGLSFDKALGIHQHTVGFRNKNAEIISNNIANSNTPGFKARGVDFSNAINSATSQQRSPRLFATHSQHIHPDSNAPLSVKYRVSTQPDTGDGNNINVQFEQSQFLENSIKYQMSLGFLDSKFSGLKQALRGR